MTEPHLEPGDRLTCADCGTTVVATFSGKWQPGYPVALAWPDRTEVTHYPPARCGRCHERAKALGLPDLPPPTPLRGAGGDLSIATAAPVPPPPVVTAEVREVPSSAAPDVLRWCVDDAGDVPEWVQRATGRRTREEIIARWGSGARFAEPAGNLTGLMYVRRASGRETVLVPACDPPTPKPPRGTQLGLFSGGSR